MNDQEALAVLHNDLRKIDLAISAKSKLLQSLIEQQPKLKRTAVKNKRYSNEIEFIPGDLTPKIAEFTVDKHTIFRPMSIDWSLRSNLDSGGDLINMTSGTGDPVQGTFLSATRNALFSFLLSVSDSGSNREWQNAPIPDTFLLGGILSPFYFGAGERAVLSADTLVIMEILPFLSAVTINDGASGTIDINSLSVVISMSGHEEFV